MKQPTNEIHAGILIGEVLAKQGVKFLYTLCGGHISPILIGAEQQGVRVIDVRHEATAVFAADATARLTGIPGVAAVTAGPGLTNTITAVKNAQMAQSPLILFGGSAATLLKGRGALQDIDQMSLMKPLCKWAKSITKVNQIVPALEKAFRVSQEGVPGPVFLEIPIDLLYPRSTVNTQIVEAGGGGKGIGGAVVSAYLKNHVHRSFVNGFKKRAGPKINPPTTLPNSKQMDKVMKALAKANRPILIIGSQAMLSADKSAEMQQAVMHLGIPTFLSGMARGLLGYHELHMRHKRTKAMRESDLIILAGVPADFRMGYGRAIPKSATYVSVNLSKVDLTKNRKPNIGILADPGAFVRMLAAQSTIDSSRWRGWFEKVKQRNDARDVEIQSKAAEETEYVNPVRLCQQIEKAVGDNSVLIGDGGDFVATASYIVRPRKPLRWLDPGAYGTLGAGGGFALASQLVYPDAEVWLLYGDGSAGYSLAEFDTFKRHNLPVIAVIGTDASWAQIAREQVELFGTALGTELERTAYHEVAQGYGGHGILVEKPKQVEASLNEAKVCASEGKPVCVNVQIGTTDFRKGSISI
ncbi:MAG: thiamine pyrophosphate-binding protein [Candidatus Promineifilaceae bacterium]